MKTNFVLTELYLNGFRGKYPKSAICGLVLRVTIYAFRADMSFMLATSFARFFLPQVELLRIMPKEIMHFDSYRIVDTLILLLEISVLLSFADISVVYACRALAFVLTTNDIIDVMR